MCEEVWSLQFNVQLGGGGKGSIPLSNLLQDTELFSIVFRKPKLMLVFHIAASC